MEKEDGEMSDNMSVDEETNIPESTLHAEPACTVVFKADKNGIIIQKLEKIDAKKLEERAQRFGLNLCGNRAITQKQIDELYAKCGIESGNERHFRFDTLHLNGIDGLTTREIFEYLEDYKPLALERINDMSCNVVCQDHISAALALLVHSREIINQELKSMLADKPDHWREGVPHPKNDLILMRFATNGDKKVMKNKTASKQLNEYIDESMDSISKNPWGDLCKSWGVYDHQEIFLKKFPQYEEKSDEFVGKINIQNRKLAKRLGKRNNTQKHSEDSDSDTEWTRKSKTPRMRMHADDEESKRKKEYIINEDKDLDREAYAPLSIEVLNARSDYTPREITKLSDKFKRTVSSTKDSIQSRLGIKVETVEKEPLSIDNNSSDSSEYNVMSRVQKVNSTSHTSSSVWDRLESKEKSNLRKDLRQFLKVKKVNNSEDLRSRIKKTKRSGLRIEIDNNAN